MVVWEIENMVTYESFVVQAESEEEMVAELEKKGFHTARSMDGITGETKFAFCSGHNSKGHEISAMEVTYFPHVSSIKDIKNILVL